MLFIIALMLSINIWDGGSFLIWSVHHSAFKDDGACKYITVCCLPDGAHQEEGGPCGGEWLQGCEDTVV